MKRTASRNATLRLVTAATVVVGGLLAGASLAFADAASDLQQGMDLLKMGKNKEKGNYFPVFMMVGSAGVEGSSPRDYQINKLFKQVQDNAITVHVVMQQSSSRSVDIGMRWNADSVMITASQLPVAHRATKSRRRSRSRSSFCAARMRARG